MAYEVEEIWRAFDTTVPANVRMRFGYTCFNMLNLFLLDNLYKSNPTAPITPPHLGWAPMGIAGCTPDVRLDHAALRATTAWI
ncbi:hypothetical protein JCM10296v2_004252 [Rhodotorula toruloides]